MHLAPPSRPSPRLFFSRPARGAVRTCLGLLALVLGLVSSAPAAAHPELETAKTLVEELEFEAALEAFARAVASGDLTRAELINLLSERTLVLHALHRQEELVADFVWLAALAPEHILDMRAPPDLVAVWKSVRDQARGPLEVRVEHAVNNRELRVKAELAGTVPPDVQTRIALRKPGADWELSEGSERVEPLEAAVELDVYAEALGPGGLVVAQAGSADAPLRIVADPLLASASAGVPGKDTDTSKRRRRGWIIGSAAAVAIAAVVTTVVLVTRDEEDKTTRLTPMVEF